MSRLYNPTEHHKACRIHPLSDS